MVESFYSILRDEIKRHIPVKTIRFKPRDKPGMTHEVRGLLKKARFLNHIAKNSGLDCDIIAHKEARKQAKKHGN